MEYLTLQYLIKTLYHFIKTIIKDKSTDGEVGGGLAYRPDKRGGKCGVR